MSEAIQMKSGSEDVLMFFLGGRCVGPPEIHVVGGPDPYVWVGDAETEACYATLSGQGLRQLRDNITRVLLPTSEAAKEGARDGPGAAGNALPPGFEPGDDATVQLGVELSQEQERSRRLREENARLQGVIDRLPQAADERPGPEENEQVYRPGQWVMTNWGTKGRIVQTPLGPAWEEDTPGGARFYRVRFRTGVEKLLSTCLQPCAPEIWPENLAVPDQHARVVDFPSKADGGPAEKTRGDSELAGCVVGIERVDTSCVGPPGPVATLYTVTHHSGQHRKLWAFNCIRLGAVQPAEPAKEG